MKLTKGELIFKKEKIKHEEFISSVELLRTIKNVGCTIYGDMR